MEGQLISSLQSISWLLILFSFSRLSGFRSRSKSYPPVDFAVIEFVTSDCRKRNYYYPETIGHLIIKHVYRFRSRTGPCSPVRRFLRTKVTSSGTDITVYPIPTLLIP